MPQAPWLKQHKITAITIHPPQGTSETFRTGKDGVDLIEIGANEVHIILTDGNVIVFIGMPSEVFFDKQAVILPINK